MTAKVWEQSRAAAREAPAPPQPAAPRARPAQGSSPAPVASADFAIQTTAGAVPAVRLPGTGRGFFVEVAGESHYQDALRALAEAEPMVRLTAEPENPHDPNAVAIQSLDGAMLGYLPREQAARYQQLVLQLAECGLAAVCQARLIGGTAEKPSVGVLLDLEGPTIVASKLGLQYKRVSR